MYIICEFHKSIDNDEFINGEAIFNCNYYSIAIYNKTGTVCLNKQRICGIVLNNLFYPVEENRLERQ